MLTPTFIIQPAFAFDINGGNITERCAVDENQVNENCSLNGIVSYRIGRDKISINKECEKHSGMQVGNMYTGLIAKPRAACGEKQGQLYLLWGQNKNMLYYELYRGETPDFKADKNSLIAKVDSGEYCVARYEDTGLKTHTYYFYRVCGVNNDKIRGEMSEVFSGLTREGDNGQS